MITRVLTAFAATAVLAGSVLAQQSRPVLNHSTVMTVLNACVAWAEERELNLSIAVLDDAGQLRGFVTMDEALLATRELAQRKAYTSVAANAPTSETGWMAQLPGVLDGGAYVPLQGGVPIRGDGGILIGAVGVSGAAADVDEDCAIVGVEAAGLAHGVDQSVAE